MTRSLHVSGQDRSSGWLSSSSSPPGVAPDGVVAAAPAPCKAKAGVRRTGGTLTLCAAGVRQGQPQGEYDGEEDKVGALLLEAATGERHVQGLGLHLALWRGVGRRLRRRPTRGRARAEVLLRYTNLFLEQERRSGVRLASWMVGAKQSGS